MITIYDTNGNRQEVTIEQFLTIEAAELAALVEMASHDPA